MPRRAPKIDDAELIDLFRDALRRGAMDWADSCRVMRACEGLTQSEFAEKVGVSLSVIKAIEDRTGNPTLATLNRIARSAGLRVGLVSAEPTVRLGTEEIVRQREAERIEILSALKQGRITPEELYAKNALRAEPGELKVGVPRLPRLPKSRKQR